MADALSGAQQHIKILCIICFDLIKLSLVTGGLIVLVHFRCSHRRRSANTFQLFGKTPEANFFKPHMVNLWVWENFLVPISVTLGQGHQATEAGQILPCPHGKVRIAHPIATNLKRYIPLVILSTWLSFGGILSEPFFFFFWTNFLRKISTGLFPDRTFYLLYLRSGWSSWCETKRKLVN